MKTPHEVLPSFALPTEVSPPLRSPEYLVGAQGFVTSILREDPA